MIPVITVDGPSGSGKGTLAHAIADELGFHFLDSGALYRIIGCVAQSRQVAFEETPAAQLAQSLDIQFTQGQVLVDDEDLTDTIRTEDAGALASQVAALPAVRDAVLALQRSFKRPPGLVADGRDMGTVVFTEAPLKIFLEASAQERAQRRYKQLKNKGLSVSLPGLLEQIQARDARDRGRTVAPLKPAEDAVVIDSTQLDIKEVFQQVLQLVVERGLDAK